MGAILDGKLIWGKKVPSHTELYDFNGNRLGLTGNYDLGDETHNLNGLYDFQCVRGGSLVLKNNINECEHGISLSFETSIPFYDRMSGSNYELSNAHEDVSMSSNPVKISKEVSQTSVNIFDQNSESYSMVIKVSGNIINFSVDGVSGTLLGFSSSMYEGYMSTLKSITSY